MIANSNQQLPTGHMRIFPNQLPIVTEYKLTNRASHINGYKVNVINTFILQLSRTKEKENMIRHLAKK